MPNEVISGNFAVRRFRGWLVIITVLVLIYIYISRKDVLTLVIFNVLGLTMVLFFSRMRTLMFYVSFEFSLIPMVILILAKGYQPERFTAVV